MIKTTLFSLFGAGAIGGFLICDFCRPASEAIAASTAAQAEAAPVASSVAEPETVRPEVEGMIVTSYAQEHTAGQQRRVMRTLGTQEPITGVAAGVPYVALPPAGDRTRAPLVVAWHMMSPPRTEAALASALPLAGLPAWRVYLGLPMFGARTPAGGFEEVMQLAATEI